MLAIGSADRQHIDINCIKDDIKLEVARNFERVLVNPSITQYCVKCFTHKKFMQLLIKEEKLFGVLMLHVHGGLVVINLVLLLLPPASFSIAR